VHVAGKKLTLTYSRLNIEVNVTEVITDIGKSLILQCDHD